MILDFQRRALLVVQLSQAALSRSPEGSSIYTDPRKELAVPQTIYTSLYNVTGPQRPAAFKDQARPTDPGTLGSNESQGSGMM